VLKLYIFFLQNGGKKLPATTWRHRVKYEYSVRVFSYRSWKFNIFLFVSNNFRK